MENSVATIQCSDANCQTSNPQENTFCDNCSIPLVKRYLWALGDWVRSYQVGQLIAERYLLKAEKIVLDTQPGVPPKLTEEVPIKLRPYLKLFPYRLHLPQVYSYSGGGEDAIEDLEICLLEYSNIPLDSNGELLYPNFLPRLTEVWGQASPLRQLNWLLQMANLWHPLEKQQMVSSLVDDPSLVRVNGSVLQLLELTEDVHSYYSIKQLGKFWLSLVDTASPLIADFLEELCHRLEKGRIPHYEYLISYLDQAIAHCGQWYQHHYQIFTSTDSGPTRDHNEDDCYPPSGELVDAKKQGIDLPFALVCDGIGGQDGGEIASDLAKNTLLENIARLVLLGQESNYEQYLQELKDLICLSNDRISQRNDAEQRQERQRMGTTLVLALARGHEIYLANVGDSRIYQITDTSCHQVTVDDDLAGREASLSYVFYRDAIQSSHSGALVQALGMSDSAAIHPNLDRLIVDENCVFLLCSDGLSDYDRVEQYWDSQIAPILRSETDIATVGKQLIKIANTKNGHDNVTIALVYCQVKFLGDSTTKPISMVSVENSLNTLIQLRSSQKTAEELPTEPPHTEPTLPWKTTTPPTEIKKSSSSSPILALVLGLFALIAITVTAYFVWQSQNQTNQDNTLQSQNLEIY
ncbi:MAG TPA: serine/threonine protein phosphatase [Cyanothece sp. UBA12306]|nr:serine/threonine protein phosphatase [Cyanothece sp. UBA12306]